MKELSIYLQGCGQSRDLCASLNLDRSELFPYSNTNFYLIFEKCTEVGCIPHVLSVV
jgi:hypothetical protein